jgi:hypothetical protein
MKDLGLYIAIVTMGSVGFAHAAERAADCGQSPAQDELTAPAPRNLAYPNFCDIPQAPKNVPTAAAFKSEIVAVRIAGRNLDQQSGPETWSLSGTEAFAATAKEEVEPPPPMTSPLVGSTEAFVKESQSLATPPARHRRKRP